MTVVSALESGNLAATHETSSTMTDIDKTDVQAQLSKFDKKECLIYLFLSFVCSFLHLALHLFLPGWCTPHNYSGLTQNEKIIMHCMCIIK